MPLTPDQFLDSPVELPVGVSKDAQILAISQKERTTKKDYRAAYIYINVTSYSQRQLLHGCSREFQIYKNPTLGGGPTGIPNIDFVFGHSVGTGIQTYLTTKSPQAALFASFLAWNADLDLENPKKGKSSSLAILAVEKFIHWWEQNGGDWELAFFRSKPATELTFFLDLENGYYHAGHIDAVLRNRRTGKYMVLEIKTTAIRNVDEAQYGNSDQPLGYSLVLDSIVADMNKEQPDHAKLTSSFEVLYLVYSSTLRELLPFPFTKSRSERAEWLQDLLLDHANISTYRKLGFFPKRGDNCWSFGGRCTFYGTCDLRIYKDTTKFRVFDASQQELPEPVDFRFTLSEIANVVGGS